MEDIAIVMLALIVIGLIAKILDILLQGIGQAIIDNTGPRE